MSFLLGPFIALAAAALVVLALRPVARRLGLVDVPNERSSHSTPTPLVGGLGIFAGVLVGGLAAVAAGWLPMSREFLSFYAGGALLALVGAIDDARDLSAASRFVAQITASLIMVYGGGVVLTDLGRMTLSGDLLELGPLAVPFTVFATLGVINAVNMCDGLDGLSGTLALVSLTGMMLAAILTGSAPDATVLGMLAAAIFGFLLFNFRVPGRPRALVFMGDAGSMFLGYALTWFAISLSQAPDRLITPAAALWFIMLPIFDTVSMMLRRIIRGRSPFSADREHIHHVFLLAGFSVNETVTIMAAGALIGVGIGLLSMDVRAPEYAVAGFFLVMGLMYFWMVMRSWKIMRFVERSICRRRNGERRAGPDRRAAPDPAYAGPERRSGVERRQRPRRTADGAAAPAPERRPEARPRAPVSQP